MDVGIGFAVGGALLGFFGMLTAAIIKYVPSRGGSNGMSAKDADGKYVTKEMFIQKQEHVSETLKRIEKQQGQMMAMLVRQQGGL